MSVKYKVSYDFSKPSKNNCVYAPECFNNEEFRNKANIPVLYDFTNDGSVDLTKTIGEASISNVDDLTVSVDVDINTEMFDSDLFIRPLNTDKLTIMPCFNPVETSVDANGITNVNSAILSYFALTTSPALSYTINDIRLLNVQDFLGR